jgi:dephospho-CoA kinase
MKVIGITGGIASGKSTVTKRLIKLGYKVVDCDEITHQLLKELTVIKKIGLEFGPEVIHKGQINRQEIGQIISNNQEKRYALNDIIHPLVIDEVQRQIHNNEEDIIFIDTPLLYEAHMQNIMDKIIVVYINPQLQKQRLIKRDKIDVDYATKKIDMQMPIDEKAYLADYLINNEGSKHQTNIQIEDIIRRIKDEI